MYSSWLIHRLFEVSRGAPAVGIDLTRILLRSVLFPRTALLGPGGTRPTLKADNHKACLDSRCYNVEAPEQKHHCQIVGSSRGIVALGGLGADKYSDNDQHDPNDVKDPTKKSDQGYSVARQ